jgi:hypothetical protein
MISPNAGSSGEAITLIASRPKPSLMWRALQSVTPCIWAIVGVAKSSYLGDFG